jgi:imidazolonepropionase-like amidohydrolase
MIVRWSLRVLKAIGALLLLILLMFLAALAWPRSAAPLPDRAPLLFIDGARIVDVESGIAGEPTRLLVREGRISAIDADLVAPTDARRIDARGQWLIPGLWDMHSHSFRVSPQLHLPLQIANGVTAVRDMMGCPGASDPLLACHADKARWSRAAAAGTLASPRFIGDASFYYNDAALTPRAVAERAAIDKASGVTLLKAYNHLSLPAWRALIAAGRRHKLPVVGHLPKAVPLAEAVRAGQQSFEHGRIFIEGCAVEAAAWQSGALDTLSQPLRIQRLLDGRDAAGCAAIMAEMAARKTAFVPTLVTREEDARARDPVFTGDPRLRYADPLSRWAYRDDAAATASAFSTAADQALLAALLKQAQADALAAHRAGIPVLVGSDTIIAGLRYHDEMALLVDAGLTPAEVLRAATLDAARFAGMEGDFGTVAIGKRADLVLLNANPLSDIGATRKIGAVLLNGHLFDRAKIDALHEYVETQANHVGNWAHMLWGFIASPASSSL